MKFRTLIWTILAAVLMVTVPQGELCGAPMQDSLQDSPRESSYESPGVSPRALSQDSPRGRRGTEVRRARKSRRQRGVRRPVGASERDSLMVFRLPERRDSSIAVDLAYLPSDLFGDNPFVVVSPIVEGMPQEDMDVVVTRDFLGMDPGMAPFYMDMNIVTPLLDTIDRSGFVPQLDLSRVGRPVAVAGAVQDVKYIDPVFRFEPVAVENADTVALVAAAAPMVDARAYSLQKRYRPADKTPYRKTDFASATFVSLGGGAFVPMMPDYSYGPSFQLAFGHVFNKYHTVQVSVEGGTYHDAYYGNRLKRAMVSASYMFNLTNYVMGYDMGRLCDFSLGAGADMIYKWGVPGMKKGVDFGLHAGVEVTLHAFKRTDLFFAPMFYAFKEPESTVHSNNWKELLPAFGGMVGCRFYMGSGRWSDQLPGLQWYFFAGSGVRMQNSAAVRKMPANQRVGFQVFAGAGRHYTDVFDLRAQVEYTRYNWALTENGAVLSAHDAALGVDALVDLVALCSRRDDIPVNLSLVAGPRVGMFDKTGGAGVVGLKKAYIGAYTGVQLKFFVYPQIRVYVEPGVSITPYCATSLATYYGGVSRNYYDALMGVNVGLEFALPLK